MSDNIIQFPTRAERVAFDDRELMLDMMRDFARGEEDRHQARATCDADVFVERVRSLGIAKRVSERQLRKLWEVATST